MKMLVTGGAGFIGSNLCEELARTGENELVILDNLQTGSRENLEWVQGKKIKLIEGKASGLGKLKLGTFDAIYHFGMPSSSPMYRENPFLVGDCINETLAIFELARKSDAKIVYASTSSLYSGIAPPQREDAQVKVTDYYTEARFAIERLAELYAKLYGLQSAGMRFFSVYGPREKAKGKYANVVSQFLWQMKEGKTPVIYGDGKQARDFIFVDDVVRACLLAMERKTSGVYNVGTGKTTSFNAVVEAINKSLGTKIEPTHVQNPIKNYVDITQADSKKSERELGFRAKVSLEEGIGKIAGL